MAGTWTVTGDQPDQYDYSGGRDPVLGHWITFTTGNGNRGTVFVAEAHYNPANVKTIIAAKAKVVDEVAALAGGY